MHCMPYKDRLPLCHSSWPSSPSVYTALIQQPFTLQVNYLITLATHLFDSLVTLNSQPHAGDPQRIIIMHSIDRNGTRAFSSPSVLCWDLASSSACAWLGCWRGMNMDLGDATSAAFMHARGQASHWALEHGRIANANCPLRSVAHVCICYLYMLGLGFRHYSLG